MRNHGHHSARRHYVALAAVAASALLIGVPDASSADVAGTVAAGT